jgi:hypothetical protein
VVKDLGDRLLMPANIVEFVKNVVIMLECSSKSNYWKERGHFIENGDKCKRVNELTNGEHGKDILEYTASFQRPG